MIGIKTENSEENMYSLAVDDTDLVHDQPPAYTSSVISNSQAGSDAQLFSTLCEIDKHNYLFLFERCRTFKINARQLRYLEKDHIRRLIPPDQLGVLAEFEHLHSEWKKQFNMTPSETSRPSTPVKIPSTIATPSASTSMRSVTDEQTAPKVIKMASAKTSPDSPITVLKNSKTRPESPTISRAAEGAKGKRSYCLSSEESEENNEIQMSESQYAFPLENIIKKDLAAVKAQYKKNGFLVERDRRLLANSIVEWFRKNSIYMSRNIMDSLAEQISEIFPTESKNAWHDYKPPNQRRGRLCLKTHNVQHASPVHGAKSVKDATNNQIEQSIVDGNRIMDTVTEEADSFEDAARIQEWLKTNECEDSDEIIQMWYESVQYRVKQFRRYDVEKLANKEAYIDDILQKWPSYKYPMGNLLLTIDFNHIHPKSETVFYQRWPIFFGKVFKLYKAEINDCMCLSLFAEYPKICHTLSDDSKHYVLMHLFHSISKPGRCIHPRQNSRRYMILESQYAFSRLITDVKEMDDYNEPFPYIFVLGTYFDVKGCYVAFRNVRYELNFMDAFYTCFQIFMVFNLNFPLPAMNFWIFMQCYLFDIEPEMCINRAIVEPHIKYMLTAN